MHRPSFNTQMDSYLDRQRTLQSIIQARRDQIITEIEELDTAIAVEEDVMETVATGSPQFRQVEPEIRRLRSKREEAQEMLFRYAERLEQEQAHLENLRNEARRVHTSRRRYAASEKLPPLWFRLVIAAFWGLAILILIGILPRG